MLSSHYYVNMNLTDPMDLLWTPPASPFLHGTPLPAASDFGQVIFLEQENASSSPLISSNNPICKMVGKLELKQCHFFLLCFNASLSDTKRCCVFRFTKDVCVFWFYLFLNTCMSVLGF